MLASLFAILAAWVFTAHVLIDPSRPWRAAAILTVTLALVFAATAYSARPKSEAAALMDMGIGGPWRVSEMFPRRFHTVCVIRPYQDQLASDAPDSGRINAFLKEAGHRGEEGVWFIVFSDRTDVELVTIRRSRYLDLGDAKQMDFELPEGFVPSSCASSADAAFVKVAKADRTYVVFGRYAPKKEEGTREERALKCYGPTLEVEIASEMTDERVSLSVPVQTFPTVHMEKETILNLATTCFPEPILADSLYFYFAHQPVPPMGLTDPTLRRILIEFGGRDRNLRSRQERVERARAEGTIRELDGWYKLYPTNDPKAGQFVSTKRKEPDGNDWHVGCHSAECSVSYGLPERKLSVQYWFKPDETPIGKWEALDVAVRTAVEGWVVSR